MSGIPGYTLTNLIHESATSVVYRGYRNDDRTPVAVKRLRSERPAPAEIARLRYEHAIAKELALPGVVKVLGVVKVGANVALIMEDAGGSTLHELISARSLTLKDALRIAISIASTLDSIHRSGVTHMDIKPQNIIVDKSTWSATIMDFGSATRLSQEAQPPASPAAFEGTLAYMSPEQTGRVNRLIDLRTDLYSLGITLYEMVTGRLPFQAKDLLELVHCHIARLPPPPAQVSTDVPRPVSDIVMKLLAKSPEDRYQGAYGLQRDLVECLAQLDATSTITPFELGRYDYVDALRIPQKLYGREAELAVLEGAWRRVCQGASELLLVSGSAGIGKSLLVGEIQRSIAQGRGYVVTGKFDQINRTTPYAAVAHVFRELVRALLTEPAEALALWRAKLRAAVGQNGRLLTDFIPELELVLGPQPDVEPLGPTESQARFHLAFQAFCSAIPAEEHPLVVFIDDLQWADPASLKLLEQVLTAPEIKHLLVIGAYRRNEIDESHLFAIALAELRKAGVSVGAIDLKPLDLPVVTRLLADTFSCDPERTLPLARHVMSKTHGNPFFMSQFMRALHAEKLVSFDPARREWTWDLPRIEEMKVTDNVVEFMTGRLRELDERAQRMLTLAACIGYRFDLKTLAIVSDQPRRDVARELSPALREGLILAVGAESRFFDAGLSGALGGEAGEPELSLDVSYRFLHDRVQHAAYRLLGEPQKEAVHLQIGRLMLAKSDPDALEGEVFEIATHMNLGLRRITDPEERVTLARLDLEAGRRAKAGAAYETAAGYFEAGVAALGPERWGGEQHDLTFALTTGLAECLCLTGRFDAGDPLFDALLEHARTGLEKAQIHNLRMSFHLMRGNLADVVKCGVSALSLLGVDLPESTEEQAALLERETRALRSYLAGREIAGLLELPVVTDPTNRSIHQTLADLTLPASALGLATLAPLTLIKQINLSIERGNSSTSAYAYVLYAVLLIDGVFEPMSGDDRFKEAYELAKIGVTLNERIPNARIACMVLGLFSGILHFFEPIRDTIKCLARARQIGLESGDLVYSSYCCIHIVSASLSLGDDLASVAEEIEQDLALMRRTNEKLTTFVLTCARQVVANLTGRTAGPHTLSDGTFDEAAFVSAVSASGLTFVSAWYHTQKVQLAYLHGDYGAARSLVAIGEKMTAGCVNNYWATELVFYSCLSATAACDGAPAAEREQLMAAIAAHREKLTRWAELCPGNYAHKHLLVEAEIARLAGDDRRAAALYERAIEGAEAGSFTRDQAIASELAARFYQANGITRCARAYMTDAYHGAMQWGATAKADRLAADAPHLVLKVERASLPPGALELARASVQATSTTRLSTSVLDVEAVIRAAQAIAGEVVLDNVVHRLLDIAIQNAGAKKGALILERDQRLLVEASITVDPNTVKIGQAVPVDESDEVPSSIVQYVGRTKEPVVLADARLEPRFAADRYVAAHNPRSILCLAMVHQGRLTGVLYLENSTASNVFTPARLELSNLLLAQAATAVENAVLYANLHRRTEALRRAEEQLRVEFSERERSERARAALQEEIIRVQDARLAELSTPMIPITDRIMVMPLIGMMDAQRAQQVLTTALNGVESSGAEVVIIDITGVRTVDSDVASTLINTAVALRLLGAQVVITGIRPDVAQTLTALQIDFSTMITRGTLQSGIAYALQRAGNPGALLGARPR